MSLITINAIPLARPMYLDEIFHQLKRIKPENKQKISVNLYGSHTGCGRRDWDAIKADLDSNGINTTLYSPFYNEYMMRIKNSVETSGKYCVKLDEDVFVTTKTWDFLIENINVLDDNNNLFVAPLLSTGIPTVDMFIDNFFKDEDHIKQHLYSIFKNTHIDNIWGANYERLNSATIHAPNWNIESFYSLVATNNHHFMGIHPIRVSLEAQQYLNERIIERIPRLFENKELSFNFDNNRPYYCNSFFAIRTDRYAEIINNRSLYVDDFDEVPVNKFRQIHNLKMVFINNAFAVHPAYNTINVTGRVYYKEIADLFFNAMKEYLKETQP
jgi:hypothetical protein